MSSPHSSQQNDMPGAWPNSGRSSTTFRSSTSSSHTSLTSGSTYSTASTNPTNASTLRRPQEAAIREGSVGVPSQTNRTSARPSQSSTSSTTSTSTRSSSTSGRSGHVSIDMPPEPTSSQHAAPRVPIEEWNTRWERDQC
ncbi:hypothetical protein AJ80_09103 [Polytolypa hystricis UAMH7299]|uniref:Uncharacterized protein n=1 Tax=Polytolypa hystricis (strain UAMH7299) TaxID=1447883 RepID=A0A2B7WWI3_POLH7|nr:hypothetical protein AJ80_09103 [Polytolypa hystricis UAMH7299]